MTIFPAATFLGPHGETYGQTADGVRTAFVMTRCKMYTGHLNRMQTKQRSIFTSQRWKEYLIGVTLELSGVKAHSSLGIGERLHEPLKRCYRKIKVAHQFTHLNYIPHVAIKAINCKMGEERLIPARLVFSVIPRFPILSTNLSKHKELMKDINAAKSGINSIIAKKKVKTAVSSNITPAADRTYQLGKKCLFTAKKKGMDRTIYCNELQWMDE